MAIDTSIYSDLDFKWRRVSSTKDINAVYDDAAINQSLISLFNTRLGERIFNPTYGTRISSLLFEPLDTLTARLLSDDMIRAINKEESSRINLKEFKITVDYDNAQYNVFLSYEIISTRLIGELQLVFQKV